MEGGEKGEEEVEKGREGGTKGQEDDKDWKARRRKKKREEKTAQMFTKIEMIKDLRSERELTRKLKGWPQRKTKKTEMIRK